MHELLLQLGIDWKILLAQIVNFAILLFILQRFVYKPVLKLLKERENRISKGIKDAKVNAEMLSATKAEYEETLSKARKEATEIFQKAKKEAEVKKTEMMESAKGDVEVMIASGKKALETEKVKMVEETKREMTSLVIEATKKVLEKEVSIESVK